MRVSRDKFDISVDADSQKVSFPIDLRDIVGILRRGWLLILVGTFIGSVAAVSYVISNPALYKSSARILIDRSTNRYLQTNKIVDEPMLDDAESQIFVISSESIIVPVVRAMNLTSDPEFVGTLKNPGEEQSWGGRSIIRKVKSAFGLASESPVDAAGSLERIAVETFIKRLTVYREDVASVISVTFASSDSAKAAKIANAVADTYLASISTIKANSSKIASQLLQERLIELRLQAANADRALLEYKMANNVVSNGKGSLSSEQLASLTTHLTNARAAMAEIKARLDRVQQESGGGVASAIAPDNEVILKLRTQYIELGAKANEIESRVGKEHMAAVKLRQRMNEVRASIREEQRRIAGTYASDYQLAKARHDELAATMTQIVTEEGSTSQVQVTIRELEASAEALRNLYNGVLQKFSEMNKAEAQSPAVQDARIITRAAPSLYKNTKRSLAVLGGGVFLGLLMGLGAAVVRESPLGVFRTAEQVTRATDVYCAVLPSVEPTGRHKSETLSDFVLNAPYSRFAEALRNVVALISGAQRENGAKVICVLSSVAKEGKTTVVTNLASLLSVYSRSRTLLIDGDIHRRSLTTRMVPNAKVGLLEALENPSQLGSFVLKIEHTGLEVLPCAHTARIPNAAELLGSPQMEKLLDTARESYDFVIIEVAPVASVVDIKMVERFIDQFVFVIEWGKTRQRLVQEALSEANSIRGRLLCILLNKADPAALRSIEAYKGPRFLDYYQEEKQAHRRDATA